MKLHKMKISSMSNMCDLRNINGSVCAHCIFFDCIISF